MSKPQIHSQLSELLADDFEYGFNCLTAIFDALDLLIYVSDLETYDLIYFNRYGVEEWGDPSHQKCFQILQQGQSKPCKFCTNSKLLDANGESTGVYVWEFQNTVNDRWYQCHDQAIKWVDGRYVRLEIAIDITDQKNLEQQLRVAHEVAHSNASLDPLLNCLNRRAFFERFDSVLAQANRNHTALTLVMMDVDNFKQINDAHGHNIGDQVLIKTTAVFKQTVRDADIFARFGGDEFILALPNTTEDNAIELLTRIQQQLLELPIEINIDSDITFSFGITSSNDKDSVDNLLNQADIALYQAKNAGRNQIQVYQSPFENGDSNAQS